MSLGEYPEHNKPHWLNMVYVIVVVEQYDKQES